MYMAVYVSSAVELFSEQQLEALLETSRENNRKLDITGMLLYKGGNFMQLLEGPKDAVTGLLAKIHSDSRHRGMIMLLQEDHAEHEFKDWAMGFKRLDSAAALESPGYSDFLDLPLTSEQFLLNPSKSLKLLLSFKKVVR
jgi:hypothetical protein